VRCTIAKGAARRARRKAKMEQYIIHLSERDTKDYLSARVMGQAAQLNSSASVSETADSRRYPTSYRHLLGSPVNDARAGNKPHNAVRRLLRTGEPGPAAALNIWLAPARSRIRRGRTLCANALAAVD
jgi:hypothetical protein